MRQVLFFLSYGLSLLFFNPSHGQTTDYPVLKKTGKKVSDFVPKGWATLAIAYGDLNKDDQQDVTLVLQGQDTSLWVTQRDGANEVEYDTNPRVLMILFKTPDGYKLADYSNTFILRANNPKRMDPFHGLSIRNNILTIDFQICYADPAAEITNAAYKFRYQNDHFQLIGADKYNITKGADKNVDYSINFMTRKLSKITTNRKGEINIDWISFDMDELRSFSNMNYPFTTDIDDTKI